SQANRVQLTLACRRNNSLGYEFADHLKPADLAKFLAGGIKSHAHRGSCFRIERALFSQGISWHGRLPPAVNRRAWSQIGHKLGRPSNVNYDYALICNCL